LGGNAVAGGKMKTTGTTWNSPNSGATNESGYSGLPGGVRDTGAFFNDGTNGNWWSATQTSTINAWSRKLTNTSSTLFRTFDKKSNGYSVRCLRD
jgi:uncharacterized protein (TIGR02145 family)